MLIVRSGGFVDVAAMAWLGAVGASVGRDSGALEIATLWMFC